MTKKLTVFFGDRWYYNEADFTFSSKYHGIHRQTVRQWARKTLAMEDGPSSASTCYRNTMKDPSRPDAWVAVPRDRSECKVSSSKACGQFHELSVDQVIEYCVGTLGMRLPGGDGLQIIERVVEKEVIVEVEKIVERIVEKPVPFALSLTFDQLAALRFGLHEAQVLLNDDIRVAMLGDDAEKALRLADRMERFHEVLAILGIEPVPDLSVVPPRGGMTEPIDAMAAQMLLLPRG